MSSIKLQSSRGTTLIEMLVATVVLGTGMVTVAGMLNDSINSLTNNLHHQRAVQLSVNLAEVLSGLHANADWPTVTPANHHCDIVTCEPANLLAHTLHDWHQQTARRLPDGRGAFQFVTEHGLPAIAIRLEWRARGGTAVSFATTVPVKALAATP